MRVPKKDRLEPPWPRLTGYDDVEPLPPEELFSGHTSSPGRRDAKPVRMGIDDDDVSGVPGIPKLRPSRRTVGVPLGGGFGSVPTQPEATIDGIPVNEDQSR